MLLTYATQEIETEMSDPKNFPEFALQAQRFISGLHEKYAPSNIYDPKTFDHQKEIGVRKLFYDLNNRKDEGLTWQELLLFN